MSRKNRSDSGSWEGVQDLDRGGCIRNPHQSLQLDLHLETIHNDADHTYHVDGPERHEAIAAVRVAPGVPARILSLFQDEHLPTEVGLLEGNKAGRRG